MNTYRKEGTFEKSYTTLNGIAMLLLVLAVNLILLIVGWAFVGFASYALISFWYRRTTATDAGMKAFVINVIGDIGMAVIAAPESVVKVIDLPDERRMQCRTSADGQLRYWIMGDWRRGRQHPIAPTIDNWKTEMGELAGLLNKDVNISIGSEHKMR